jgi:Leucine Rich repeats (2 copies)/Leucine rich repeat N-terminal domain
LPDVAVGATIQEFSDVNAVNIIEPRFRSLRRVWKRVACGLAMLVAAAPGFAAVSQAERNALLAIYNAAQGSQWTNRAGWNGDAGTECYWSGVTCDAAQATVVSLILTNNNLHGTLAPLTSLTNLTQLDVAQNTLTGSLPQLTGLSQLQVFNAFSNQFSGPVPALTGLLALREFRIWGNQLTGAIPALTDVTALKYFDAQSNQLSGAIPALVQLTGLIELIVSNNQLTGSLPALTGLTSLQKLDVSSNQLSGSLPDLSSDTALRTLYIDSNQFSGALPAPPSNLGSAIICPNALLTQDSNATWDLLSGTSPWYQTCAGLAKLAIININGGVNPTVGSKFSVTVQAQNSSDQATTVNDYTSVSFSLAHGSGQLYSQSSLQCTIPAGGTSCTVSDASYSIVDSAVQIQAGTYYNYGVVLQTPPSAAFSVVAVPSTVGGTVSGLAGPGLVVSLYPGSQRMAIAANGAFTFPLPLGNGAYYAINVQSSPTAPLQQCSAQGVGNIAGTKITSLQVTCVTLRTVTVIASPNGYVSGTQTVNSGTAANLYIAANSGFYPQVTAVGCTITRTSDTYWMTNPLSGDCSVTAVFVATQFVPLNPARLLDTRAGGTTVDGNFAATGAIAASTNFPFTVLGRGGVPSSGVGAVVLNVMAVNPNAPGYLTAWPSCSARPLASNLNFAILQTVANLTVVGTGCDATSNLFTSSGPTNVTVDVVGYFKTGPDVTPLVPARLLDTRPGTTTIDGIGAGVGTPAAGGRIDLQVSGRAGIPSTGAAAVALNVTATDAANPGYATIWPTDQAKPLASNLNFVPGQTIPNLVISKLSSAGQISLYNSVAVDLIADVTAWFPTSADLVPITPARLVDTRTGFNTIDGQSAGGGPLKSTQSFQFQTAGRGGVPGYGVNAVVLNVTVTNPSSAGSLTIWPSYQGQPQAANLNFVPGQTVPNLVIVSSYYYGSMNIAISAGTADVVVDVVGWFVGP